jgi:hypothetical protein
MGTVRQRSGQPMIVPHIVDSVKLLNIIAKPRYKSEK